MKKINLTLIFLFFLTNAFSQKGWTFIKGNAYIPGLSVYGVRGQFSENNIPCSRVGAASFSYNGSLFLFGGNGNGTLNDLWAFDSLSHMWKWLGGGVNQSAVYTTKGVADTGNIPAGRSSACYWFYNNKFYVFGGMGKDGLLNDLWTYDPIVSTWTFLKGSTAAYQDGTYGTKNVSDSNNIPGARSGASFWIYNNKLYLFGGNGMASGVEDRLNDLWVYDPLTNNWTWIKGSNTTASSGYGTKGVADTNNNPHSRENASQWVYNNKLYLFGGDAGTGIVQMGDLWCFDPSTNIWKWIKGNGFYDTSVYGTINVEDSLNEPGARGNCITWVEGNETYLFGGDNYGNDLWRYNSLTNNWTWINGTKKSSQNGIYGPLNVYLPGNMPGCRYSGSSWVLNGHCILFGGEGSSIIYNASYSLSALNDMWDFDTGRNNWKWVKGPENIIQASYYSTSSTQQQFNTPGASSGEYVQLDSSFFMYNGSLWKFEPFHNVWTLLKNSTTQIKYGNKGISNKTNSPGIRIGAAIWANSNKIYLLGGSLYGGSGNYYNDLWEFDLTTNNWTWINGDSTTTKGFYGSAGISSVSNMPGARIKSMYCSYNGKLYLFGGYGSDSSDAVGELNDLWSYDPATNNWTWLKGSPVKDQAGAYGALGSYSNSNNPGGRTYGTLWVSGNNIYLFGGNGYSSFASWTGELDDLWQYNIPANEWRWKNGSKLLFNYYGTYGTKGVSSASNMPGTRYWAASWALSGHLYLLGGYGTGATSGGMLNDFWDYDTVTNNWTWIGGSDDPREYSKFITIGKADTFNMPGSRSNTAAWQYHSRLYLFGGVGFGGNGDGNNNLDDIWYYEACDSTAGCYQYYPGFDIKNHYALCGSNPIGVNAGNTGSSFLWNTGDTSQLLAITAPGTYWVRVTTNNLLSASDTFTVSNVSLPIINLGKDTLLCQGIVDTLDAKNTGDKYAWSNADTTQKILINSAGTYSVLVADSLGCIASDTIHISYASIPQVNLGKDTAICQGQVDTLKVGGKYAKILWSTTDTTQYLVIKKSGSYNVNVTDSNNCHNADTINISVNLLPVVLLGKDTAICAGNSVKLSVSIPKAKIAWSTGDTTTSIFATTKGQYSVQVTDSNLCINSDTLNLTIDSLPSADTVFVTRLSAAGFSFSIVNARNASSYLWLFGDGKASGASFPSHIYASSGNYIVTLIMSNKCGDDTLRAKIHSSLFVDQLPTLSSKIVLYPNPASGEITIGDSSDITIHGIEIMSMDGHLVLKDDHFELNNNKKVNIQPLMPGMYLVRLQCDNGTAIIKLVKQ